MRSPFVHQSNAPFRHAPAVRRGAPLAMCACLTANNRRGAVP